MIREADPGAAEDRVLEAAYLAEFAVDPPHKDTTIVVGGVARRAGDLRAFAIHDLANRITEHHLLRRADDTARISALRFVERRLVEGQKIAAYSREGAFPGFLRRVLHNLLLDWLRSPNARAELRRAEHDPSVALPDEIEEMPLPGEIAERTRVMTEHHAIATRALRALPPGRGVPLRLSLWPAYDHDPEDVLQFGDFSLCHETASSQTDARACDSGKRCVAPDPAWRTGYAAELDAAKAAEPAGLSRKVIAELLRIGVGKPTDKREGAICERISKGRLMLLDELRRTGVENAAS